MKDNNIVNSYHIDKYPSGIISLTINTVNKGCDVFRVNNNTYLIEDFIQQEEYQLDIPELKIPSMHSCTNMYNKDQHIFYWIPWELISKDKLRDKIVNKRK